MTINNQEILKMLEFPNPNEEVNDAIKDRQRYIESIMELENPGKPKDLISIARNFKELVKLNEDELEDRYLTRLKQQYPDFKLSLEDGDIHASLYRYEGDTLPEFPPGLKKFDILGCKNLELLPEFPSSLKELNMWYCPNLESVPKLPLGLEHLSIYNFENLEVLPEFPSSLKSLDIEECPNLTQKTLDRIYEFKKKQS